MLNVAVVGSGPAGLYTAEALVKLAAALSLPTAAGAGASVGLSDTETRDLRLLYYDPIQTYLVPYVGRSYEHALAFHETLFDWTPWDKPSIYLRDLRDSDAGRKAKAAIRDMRDSPKTGDKP